MEKYNQLTPEIIAQIQAVSDHVLTGDDINADFARDEMPIYGTHMPDLVVQPTSTEEVAAVMKICYENTIPVTPRGAGTGLAGGAVPLLGGVLMDTSKMNRILSYDMENFVVEIESGVLLNDLANDCISKGMMYPPDPGEKFACVGGNVSTNAGGMRAVKYGATRDYVRAMTVVLPTGEITHLGATVSKTSSGYSLLNLMIGSEGTLGIITEMTMKLVAKPSMNVSVLLPFESLDTCIATVPKIRIANLDPQSIEFMGEDIVRSSSDFTGKPIFPTEYAKKNVAASILVTFVGESEDELYEKMEKLDALASECGAIDTLVVDTPTLKTEVWAARSAFLSAIEGDTKLLDELDVVVPVDQIAPYLEFVRKTGEEVGLTIRNFGHAGDGNLHIYCCSNDLAEDEFKARAEKFMEAVYIKATELGGQVSGEHGIGSGKVAFLAESLGGVNMRLMEEIKKVFDPNLILNPGKVCYKL